MRFLPIVCIFFIASSCAYGLNWSEVMFNPLGSDNGREFIELTGTESLANCSVSDAASSDTLVLNKSGSSVLLILEDNYLIDPGNATVYTAGAAIGNGLGNTADSILIACNGATLLNMSYNISEFAGYKEGHSLEFNGTWNIGPMNGTPGVALYTVPTAINMTNVTNTTNETNETITNATNETIENDSAPCDETLLIELNATMTHPGDQLLLEIISPGYAAFDIMADNVAYASGDTLTTRKHIIIVPHGDELKVVARAQECGNAQRAIRYVKITEISVNATKNETNETNETNGTRTRMQLSEYETLERAPAQTPVAAQAEAVATQAEAQPAPKPQSIPVQSVVPDAPERAAAQPVLLDENTNAVPWIAAFGIVTVAASVTVFLHLLRRGQV